jgi:hypothetical protein
MRELARTLTGYYIGVLVVLRDMRGSELLLRKLVIAVRWVMHLPSAS